MERFNLGSLADWKLVELGELIAFDLPENGYRKVSFDLLSDRPIRAYLVSKEEAWTVAVGCGLLEVVFSMTEGMAMFVESDHEGAEVRLRTRDRTQRIAEAASGSYTSPMPQRAPVSPEVQRYMHALGENIRRREAAMMAEVERRLAEANAVIEDDPPKPKAKAKADPQPEGETEGDDGGGDDGE